MIYLKHRLGHRPPFRPPFRYRVYVRLAFLSPFDCGQRGFFKTNCEFGQLPTPPATTSHPSCPSLFNSFSSFLLLVCPTTLYFHLVMQPDRGASLE